MSNEVTRIEEKGIPLASLMGELRELLELRDELRDAEGVKPEDRAAVDTQIKAYVEANLRKVDNVRAFWRYAEDMMASADRDFRDAQARYGSWKAKLDYLKTLCVEIMTGFNEKKLEGQHGYIRLQANGGKAELDVYSAALVPEELVLYRGWMSAACMALLPPEVTARQDFQFERVPRQEAVRAELEKTCEGCGGDGKSYHTEKCDVCAGTGKRIVPGARLAPRGVHARIR